MGMKPDKTAAQAFRRSYYLVARGNNRNNGGSLGAVTLNANNALGNSNGNNWRSRSTYSQKQEINYTVLSNSIRRGSSALTTQGAVADGAVKALHTSAVSRSRKRLEDCGRERWCYAA